MKKLFLLLIFLPMLMFSQTKTITGTVYDAEGITLPGVSIVLKNAQNIGTTTSFEGDFSLEIPVDSKQILVFSYIGFLTQEIDVSNLKTLSVTLHTTATQLEEVVVVGYGTVLKKDVTGSLASIKVEGDLANQSYSIDQLLQGRAAGVQVIQNAGAPGSGISVRIRGTSSLRGNNEPLYVIDGVIISSAGEDVQPAGGIGNTGQEIQNGLSGLNPRDIESIQVLKDASATAIYGSRGANGVVLITTKRGTDGKVNISTFASTSVKKMTKQYDVLDGAGYALYQNEIDIMNGANPVYSVDGSQVYAITYTDDVPNVSTVPAQIYNWQDELFQQGFSKKAGISMAGGSDNGDYYISAGIDDQQGIVDNSSMSSGDFRINLNQDLSEKLQLEARISASIVSTDFAESGDLIGANQSFIRNAISFRPVISAEIEDLGEELEASNPYSWINDFSDVSKEKRYIGSLGLTYQLPIKGLKYEFRAGGNIRTKDRRRFYGVTTYQGANANGALQISTLNTVSYQINNFLRYYRTFDRKHRVNATLGVTYDVRNVDNSVYAVEDFVTTELTTEQPFLASVISQPLQFLTSDQQIFSILGRLNYTLNNEYILTASFRRDGVSKFSEENRFGFFPSFALAWRLENKDFIKKLNFFEDLKLRVGWGQIGNHGISPYGTLSDYGINGSLYGTPTGGTSIPLTLNNIANPDLTWEKTEQLNFGLDFTSKKNKISGSIDVYDKKTKDLLQRSPIPTSSGFSFILLNRGGMSNKGLELALNVLPVSSENFEINFGGNISFNKSKITSLGIPLDDFYIDGIAQQRSFYFGQDISRGNIFKSPANVFVEGEEPGLFYGFETNGIYQTTDTDIVAGAIPGDVRIVDQNGDGIIDLRDRTFIGNPNPDFVFGFNLNFKYKRFNANFLFNGSYGNDIANGNLLQLENAEGIFSNISPDAYYDAWRPDNPSNEYPRIGFTTNGRAAISDRIIEDGSFLRLSNVTLSYEFPVKNLFVERLNVYIAGQNLITWTGYSGYDPEITSFMYTGLINGVDWNGAPNARTLLFGLNVNF